MYFSQAKFFPATYKFLDDQKLLLETIVNKIHCECPGQIQSRYIDRIASYKSDLLFLGEECFKNTSVPIHLQNLPKFHDIEKSKILLLLLGESLGRCVAYSDYNQSYITDIRPTKLSSEKSSGIELLSMHNDLTFASDRCRPRNLVLVPHIANSNSPKTLLASAKELSGYLDDEDLEILSFPIFEIRSGSKLRWPAEQIKTISIFYENSNKELCVRMNFDSITVKESEGRHLKIKAKNAMDKLLGVSLEVGRNRGIVIEQGCALMIPNDTWVHGRDAFEMSNQERMLLRSYVVPQDVVDLNFGNTMISLRD